MRYLLFFRENIVFLQERTSLQTKKKTHQIMIHFEERTTRKNDALFFVVDSVKTVMEYVANATTFFFFTRDERFGSVS